jgi:hypothetical protein
MPKKQPKRGKQSTTPAEAKPGKSSTRARKRFIARRIPNLHGPGTIGTLLPMTGDETDEELDQMTEAVLKALGLDD